MFKQTKISNDKINKIEAMVEEQNKKIIQLESAIMQATHPSKFKLGDCVKTPINALPNKIIRVEWEQRSARPYRDSFLKNYQYGWVYTCINKNYVQTIHEEYLLHLTKEKVDEEN